MLLLAPSVPGLFKWRQFEPEVILLAVGWYLRLDFAIGTGLEHGEYVPRGRKAEDGRIDDRYNLIELSTS